MAQFFKPRRPSIYGRFVLLGVLCASLSLLLIWILGQIFIPSGISIALPGGQGRSISIGVPPEKIILVMGVDVGYSERSGNNASFQGVRTDTMMLVRISPGKRTISAVSIPRDSKVFLAGRRGIDKINAAFAIGGSDMAVKTVEESFGIPIDNYIVVNLRGVRELVDTMDGVDVYVDKRMRYRDRTAKLNIDFEKGYHHLSGQQAEEFLRFRHDELGDIGRIRRQQYFMSALVKEFKNPWTLTKIPTLVSVGSKYVQTDMSFNDMLRVAWFAKEVDPKEIRVATIPGRPSLSSYVSYWIIDASSAQEVLDRLILDNPSVTQPGRDNPLRVGILYASEHQGQLEQLVASMERANFKVICKSPRNHSGTQIIEHSSRVTDLMTRKLRSTNTSLQGARLIFAPVGTTFESNTCSAVEDYTVIVGEDVKSQSRGS